MIADNFISFVILFLFLLLLKIEFFFHVTFSDYGFPSANSSGILPQCPRPLRDFEEKTSVVTLTYLRNKKLKLTFGLMEELK